MLLALAFNAVLLALAAVAATVLVIKYMFLLPLDETLNDTQQLCFESPNSTQPIVAPSLLRRDKADANGGTTALKSLTVVIPAYNEELRLPGTLDETMRYLQQRRAKKPAFTYEVIVVDDGSSDATSEVAFEYVKKHGVDAVRLLTLRSNKGKGYAVKAGIMCSRGKLVLFMDADGATAIEEVEKLERALEAVQGERATERDADSTTKGNTAGTNTNTNANANTKANSNTNTNTNTNNRILVAGSRAHLQATATAKRTALRNFLMHGFHALVTLVVGNEIRDTQCGFKLMTREAAQAIVPQQRLQRWAFDVELIKLAGMLGVRMREVQVVWTEIPGSKVRVSSIVHIAFELLLIKIGYDVLRTWAV